MSSPCRPGSSIRREKATSNITTNQTLLALAGLAHLSWLGPQGLREVGETCMALAEYAKDRLELPPLFPDKTTFKEFAIRTGRPAEEAIQAARALGVHPGYALKRDLRRDGGCAARLRHGEEKPGGH